MKMVSPLNLILLIAILFSVDEANAVSAAANGVGMPIVRNISEIGDDSYGIPGLSHVTVAGSLIHGLKEVEVWFETLAPGSGTPVHRHLCEEVFVFVKGNGTVLLALRNSDSDYPGDPHKLPVFANSTIHIPPDEVHQIINTNEHEDLQFIVIISRPPMKVFIYDDWFTPHDAAKLKFPMFWDEKFHQTHQSKDEL